MKSLFLSLFIIICNFCFGQRMFDLSHVQQPGTVPTLNANVSSISGFISTSGSQGPSQSYLLTGSNLGSNNVTVQAPTNYVVSKDNITFAASVTITPSSGSVTQTIYVAIASTAGVGSVTGTLTNSCTGAGVATVNIGLSGTASSGTSPSLSVSTNTINNLNTVAGTSGSPQTFTVTFANIVSNVTATVVPPVEISQDGSTWNSSNVSFSTGSPKTIYVRVASSASAGSYTDSVIVTTTGATQQRIDINGTVSAGGITNDTINLNFYDQAGGVGSYINGAWNNWSPTAESTTNQTSPTLNYATGSASPGITVTVTANATTTNMFYTDNGNGYASSTTTGFPPTVFRTPLLYNDDGPDSLIINNLPAANNNYTVIIGSSRSTATARPQTVVCNGITLSGGFDAQNNINNVIRFNNVARNVNNKIIVIFTAPLQTSGNRFMFINFVQLIKNN